MQKENVFLVSGRYSSKEGAPRGIVSNYVVCSVNEASLRRLMEQEAPDFAIVHVASLVMLEATVKKVKAVLAGDDKNWLVLVDPALQALAEA